MKFIAEIDIMPHQELFDPQGNTVANYLKNINIHGIEAVRIGKHITIALDAESESEAGEKVEIACKQLLANHIMETYTFKVTPAA